MSENLTPNNQSLPTMELKDIELPMSPGFDWSPIAQFSSVLLLLLLLLAGLVVLMRFYRVFNQSLLMAPFTLRWRLWQLKKAFRLVNGVLMTTEHSRGLYDWSEQLYRTISKIHQAHHVDQHEELLHEAHNLKVVCEYMTFSNEPVSRETYCEAIRNAQVLLNKALSVKFVCRCLYDGLFAQTFNKGSR